MHFACAPVPLQCGGASFLHRGHFRTIILYCPAWARKSHRSGRVEPCRCVAGTPGRTDRRLRPMATGTPTPSKASEWQSGAPVWSGRLGFGRSGWSIPTPAGGTIRMETGVPLRGRCAPGDASLGDRCRPRGDHRTSESRYTPAHGARSPRCVPRARHRHRRQTRTVSSNYRET